MKLAKTQHEAFAKFFEQPKRETFRELIKYNIGETDYSDFKAEWPDFIKVSKHILALANSGGGALVFGVHQADQGNLEAKGLSKLTDKVDVSKAIKKYVPTDVNYEIFDFSYTDSEYPSLKGKMFQVLLVEYSDKFLPVLSLKEGDKIKANVAYLREGTESIEANHKQLQHLINLRIESGYSSSQTLDLREHLDQLEVLYNARKKQPRQFELARILETQTMFTDPLIEYYKFIEDMISYKQSCVQKELELDV